MKFPNCACFVSNASSPHTHWTLLTQPHNAHVHKRAIMHMRMSRQRSAINERSLHPHPQTGLCSRLPTVLKRLILSKNVFVLYCIVLRVVLVFVPLYCIVLYCIAHRVVLVFRSRAPGCNWNARLLKLSLDQRGGVHVIIRI